MKLIFTVLLSLFSFQLFALDVGLETGSTMNTLNLSGSLMLYCNDSSGSGSRYVNCSSSRLLPAEFSRLKVTGGRIDASKVELTAHHQDGSMRQKSSRFNSNRGESTKRFNLWIGSLFQRPLLEEGENRIVYRFINNGSVVNEGEFTVTINEGESRQCPFGVLYSSRGEDCRTGSMVCGQYFRKYNYCR